MVFLSEFAFSSSQYPHCFLPLGLGSFGASPALLPPDSFLLSRPLPLPLQCLPFWDPAWEIPLPTFIPGTAGTELSSESGCPSKSFYFVPKVSVPNQLAQECTEKVMAKQSAYYTHLIAKAFGYCLGSVGQLTGSVYWALIVQLIKAVVWARVNIPLGLCLHLPPMSLLSQHRFDCLIGKMQYYFIIATIWFKENW